jgi:hypothetical protein
LPGRTQTQGVGLREQKGGGNIRIRFQGVHQQHTANDSFQIPLAFNTAGNFHPWFVRKGDKMKSIPQAQVIPQKRAGKVLVDPVVVPAHGGGSIQEQHKIDRRTLLSKDNGGRKKKKT